MSFTHIMARKAQRPLQFIIPTEKETINQRLNILLKIMKFISKS